MSRPAPARIAAPAVAGFAMPALIAMLAVMTLALLIAMPSWRYLLQDDKEQELIFRGQQISSAIARFQRKNGNALPISMEQLVDGKYLRKAYKDPMTREGRWRIVRPGEAGPARPGPSSPGVAPGRPAPSPSPSATPVFGAGSGTSSGPMAGVASLSTEQGFRSVNGSQTYNRWLFAPNIPFLIGAQPAAAAGPPGQNQMPSQRTLRAPDLEAPRLSR